MFARRPPSPRARVPPEERMRSVPRARVRRHRARRGINAEGAVVLLFFEKIKECSLALFVVVGVFLPPVRWARRRAAPRLRRGSSRRARPSTRATSTRWFPCSAAPRRTRRHKASRARRVPRIPRTQPRGLSSRSGISGGGRLNTTRARERLCARHSARRLRWTRCWIDSRGASSPRISRRRAVFVPVIVHHRRMMTEIPKKTNPEALCVWRSLRELCAAAPPPATPTPSRVSRTPFPRKKARKTMSPPPRIEPATNVRGSNSRARSRPSRRRREGLSAKKSNAKRFFWKWRKNEKTKKPKTPPTPTGRRRDPRDEPKKKEPTRSRRSWRTPRSTRRCRAVAAV